MQKLTQFNDINLSIFIIMYIIITSTCFDLYGWGAVAAGCTLMRALPSTHIILISHISSTPTQELRRRPHTFLMASGFEVAYKVLSNTVVVQNMRSAWQNEFMDRQGPAKRRRRS